MNWGNMLSLKKRGVWLDLRFCNLWQLTGICGIAINVIAGNGLLQGAVQDAVNILDRLGG